MFRLIAHSRSVHFVDDEHHVFAAILLNGKFAEMIAHAVIKALIGDDENQQCRVIDFVVRFFVVVGTEFRMNAGRVNDFKVAPSVGVSFLCFNARADFRVNAG